MMPSPSPMLLALGGVTLVACCWCLQQTVKAFAATCASQQYQAGLARGRMERRHAFERDVMANISRDLRTVFPPETLSEPMPLPPSLTAAIARCHEAAAPLAATVPAASLLPLHDALDNLAHASLVAMHCTPRPPMTSPV